jgi:hypothetical protein
VIKWGFIDRTGKIVIPPQFDNVGEFHSGLAAVNYETPGKPSQWEFIDKSGKVVVGPGAGGTYGFSDGLALVMDTRSASFIDTHGKTVFKPEAGSGIAKVCNFHEGLAAVTKYDRITSTTVVQPINGHAGYIDHSGRIAIPFRYTDASDFSEGLAAVKVNQLWGYIDKSGKFVIPATYQSAGRFSEGLAWVCEGIKSCYIDKSGHTRIVTEEQATNIGMGVGAGRGVTFVAGGQDTQHPESDNNFHNGLALTRKPTATVTAGLFGFMNHAGQIVIKPRYDVAGPFSDGLARVREGELGSSWYSVDAKGHTVVRPAWSWFYIDTKGHTAVQPIWNGKQAQDAHDFSEGLAAVAFEVSPGQKH